MDVPFGLGLILGTLQGYLFMPTLNLGEIWGRWLSDRYGDRFLPITRATGTLMLLLFLGALHLAVALELLELVSGPHSGGRGWGGGLFIGGCAYALLPPIESALRGGGTSRKGRDEKKR